jgi:hypothetical protein
MTTLPDRTTDNERRSYRKVYKRLWSDPDFIAMTDSERIMALYVLTGSQTNRIGLFKFSIPLAAEDLKRPLNTIRRVFANVVKAFRWEYDVTSRVLWIPSWWKYNPPPKQSTNIKGYLADLSDLPRTALIARFRGNLADVPVSLHDYFAERSVVSEPSTAPSSERSTARTQPEQTASTPRATNTHTHTQGQTHTHAAPAALSRPPSIQQRRNPNAAWEGPRGLCVLHRQHEQFVASRNGDVSEVLAFYAEVGERWGHGDLRAANIDPDMPKFWNARYAEKWPPANAKAAKPDPYARIRATLQPTGTEGQS